MTLKNLYYNLLPIIAPSPKNVSKFLDKAVFCRPNHQLSADSENLIVEYEVFALTRYKDKTQKPYFMSEELKKANVDTYLLVGDKDILFPHQKSVANAKSLLPRLREVVIYPNVGHGVETFPAALRFVGETIIARQ